MVTLSEKLREKLVQALAEIRYDGIFGDGQEHEYIYDGFPSIKGLNQCSDEELVKEYVETVDYEGVEDSLLEEVKSEVDWIKFSEEHFGKPNA